MKIRWLGRISYAEALELQEQIVAGKISDPRAPDEFLLLEHEPVYTMGRTPDQTSLKDVSQLPFAVVHTNRGGQATYHGPGQLVGYPLLDLNHYGRDLHRYLRVLEDSLVAALHEFQAPAETRKGLTGVWVGTRKIASIGVGIRRWISMHGFALNVSGDLGPFSEITPCGIAGVEMTSLSRECGFEMELQPVAESIARHLRAALDRLHASSGAGDR